EDRRDVELVSGCVSRVWVVGHVTDGVCGWRVDADSQVVRGLATVLAEVCEGVAADEVETLDLSVLAGLGVLDILSPTRANGLERVAGRIREIARTG
ncbi:MAG: SufE family protein, partial [Chthoniobacterales bacterium]